MSRAGALRLIRVSGGAKDNAIPRERLHIASTERTWRLLLGTLKRLDA